MRWGTRGRSTPGIFPGGTQGSTLAASTGVTSFGPAAIIWVRGPGRGGRPPGPGVGRRLPPLDAQRRSSSKNSRIVVAVLRLDVSEQSLGSAPRAAFVGGCQDTLSGLKGAGLGKSPSPDRAEAAAEPAERCEARDPASEAWRLLARLLPEPA